jgi:hypothetical protein
LRSDDDDIAQLNKQNGYKSYSPDKKYEKVKKVMKKNANKKSI